jgi:rhodanese-related sulfurtransferase
MRNEKNQSNVFVYGFLLIILVVLWFFLKPVVLSWKNSSKIDPEKAANAEILKAPSIMPSDLFQMIQDQKKVFLIDISSVNDFDRGHIATSLNASADKIDSDFFKTIGAEKTASIFLINQGNNDLAGLAKATNVVVAAGFVNAQYLRGGIAGWREEGYPLVSGGKAETDQAKVKKISIEEIRNQMEQNSSSIQFLDVRDSASFSKGHITGALSIPLSDLETRKKEIPVVQKVVVYGASQDDSFQAAVILFDLNFFNIYQLDATFDDWKTAGGKVEQ